MLCLTLYETCGSINYTKGVTESALPLKGNRDIIINNFTILDHSY